MPDQPEPLRRMIDAIESLAARQDLAAVILHLNDTYQIEARPPDIPGMARVAMAVECITNLVRKLTGEDRTLVVHSGDFLSPSYMTTRLGFAGKQVVELINCCGIDYATIGNHEFDVSPAELNARLNEASFPILCANLIAPPSLPSLHSVAYWPSERPFLALSGLVGAQTIMKAVRPAFGYRVTDREDALAAVLKKVQAEREIGALVLLTHMDREEDKETQQMLRRHWDKDGAAFVLGGHDHDISWQEPSWNSVLCKNLSNCRTLTAVILSKSAVAAPAELPSFRYRDREDFVDLIRNWRGLDEHWDSASLPAGAAPFQEIVDRTVETWRNTAPPKLPVDFVDAFATHLTETAATLPHSLVEKEDYLQGAERMLFELAMRSEFERFRFPTGDSGILTLDGKSELGELSPHDGAQQAVDRWVSEMETKAGPGGDEVLADFCRALPPGERLNGQDDSMRSRSTDFGNFAADAVEIATGADIAMLNAGCFRLDDLVGPTITLRDLQETFLYDHAEAVVVVELDTDEVRAMCAHGQQKSGNGAFLQVSRGFESISARMGPLRVALVRHMIVDNEDRFQSLLASLRGWTPDDVPRRLSFVGPSAGLIDLVSRGSRLGVAYSAANRLAGTTEDEKLVREAFMKCVERYLAVCRTLDLAHREEEFLDFDSFREPIHRRVAYERLLVRALVMHLAFTFGLQWLREDFYNAFSRSDLQYRKAIEYHRFLDKAMVYLDLRILHPRLRDEEGQSELPDAAFVAPNIPPHRATNTIFGDAKDAARLFADRIDEYIEVCRSHGVAYPGCQQLIGADPQRAPPIQPIRDARLDLRHALLIVLVDLGLDRVRSELSAELTGLNGRDGRNARYDEYLESALTYFDIVCRYGLLVDEERDAPA